MTRTSPGLAVALALLAAPGCGASFDPLSLVEKPRVLGIVASPPDLPLDGTTRLDLVAAFPDEVASVAWTACPLSLGSAAQYACAVPELPVAGTGATAAFSGSALAPYLEGLRAFFAEFVGFARQVVEQDDACLRAVIDAWDACTAREGGDAPACVDAGYPAAIACIRAGGLDVSFRAHVAFADGRAVDAYKRVLFRDPDPARPPNRNPGLDGVNVSGLVVREGDAVEAVPGTELRLEPVLDADAVESFTDAGGKAVDETIFFTWYATSGRFAWSRSTLDAPENRLRLDAAAAMPPVTDAWLFAHDDRLGQAYVHFRIVPKGGGADAGGTP
jgi:hypothetical protein